MSYAIGQTVLFKKSVTGHVVLVTATEISVRTSLTGRTIMCQPSELEILSEEALPLEPISNSGQVAASTSLGTLPAKVPKVPSEGTKLARAIILFKTARDEGKSRKETIALFVDKLTMSEAGASTYYSLCQKATLN